MTSLVLLSAYAAAIIAASLLGIWMQSVVRLTHTRVQTAMSFVAGLVIGVALYHLLPHSLMRLEGHEAIEAALHWMVAGIVAMVLLQRVFPPFRHDQPVAGHGDHDTHSQAAESRGWLGIAVGMGLHAMTEGAALGAAVLSQEHHSLGFGPVSLGICLGIVLHKPIDALFVAGMARIEGVGRARMIAVSIGIAVICPATAYLTFWGIGQLGPAQGAAVGNALAFGAGALVCIALSELLPEIHFHRHDRLRLTASFLGGLVLAFALELLES